MNILFYVKILINADNCILIMALYGIYGSHTTESCPLSNIRSRNIVLKMAQDLDNIANKNKITILDQYHSALEHTFLWTVDAESAHSAERFMIELQWSVFNALKIVPLGRYENVVEACKKLDAA